MHQYQLILTPFWWHFDTKLKEWRAQQMCHYPRYLPINQHLLSPYVLLKTHFLFVVQKVVQKSIHPIFPCFDNHKFTDLFGSVWQVVLPSLAGVDPMLTSVSFSANWAFGFCLPPSEVIDLSATTLDLAKGNIPGQPFLQLGARGKWCVTPFSNVSYLELLKHDYI